jgi:hypothetical protein
MNARSDTSSTARHALRAESGANRLQARLDCAPVLPHNSLIQMKTIVELFLPIFRMSFPEIMAIALRRDGSFLKASNPRFNL